MKIVLGIYMLKYLGMKFTLSNGYTHTMHVCSTIYIYVYVNGFFACCLFVFALRMGEYLVV